MYLPVRDKTRIQFNTTSWHLNANTSPSVNTETVTQRLFIAEAAIKTPFPRRVDDRIFLYGSDGGEKRMTLPQRTESEGCFERDPFAISHERLVYNEDK